MLLIYWKQVILAVLGLIYTVHENLRWVYDIVSELQVYDDINRVLKGWWYSLTYKHKQKST